MRKAGSGRGLRLAAVQMCSGPSVEKNLEKALGLISQGAELGADLIALPENFALMGSDRQRAEVAQGLDGPILTELRRTARRHAVAVLAGTFPESCRAGGDRRPYNTSVLIGRRGEIAAVYRKLHLFDVSLPDGTSYEESRHIRPGSDLVTARFGTIGLGLTICYDLRFPELYRALALRGAQVIIVPSAFTLLTGKDHWIPLLRARAIENQVYVVAPAQFGTHESGRQTYGHSAIVDPWGTVIAQASDQECVIRADLDPAFQEDVRRRIPVFDHLRTRAFEQALAAAKEVRAKANGKRQRAKGRGKR
ncbi:MAG: carbon-nitrogen hydrolase family protein [bacterium]